MKLDLQGNQMERLVPTLFLEIYRKCFGATYDVTQESTWWWLTAQHISNFYTPAYTRDDPPNTCLTLHEGHRPKMFLWMVEEFAFILCHLRKDDRDGALVLGHELLLLVRSHCCRKRESRHAGATPLDRLPACPFQTLERAMLAPDTIHLERLAWAVFDNIMGPGEAPPLCGFETYDQIVGHLAGKAYKGVHMHCPAHTSASFGTEVTTSMMVSPDSRKAQDPGVVQWHGMWEKISWGHTPLLRKNKTLQKETNHTHQHVRWTPTPREWNGWSNPNIPTETCNWNFGCCWDPNWWRRGTYPSTSPQTLVCLALVFSCGPSNVPSRTYIHGHRILAARK